MKRLLFLTLQLTLLLSLAACALPTVEVTRVVVQSDPIDVTRIVTHTQVVVQEAEVTRVVEVTPVPAPRGELIVALASEPNSLYSANAAERNAQNVARQLYEGLLRVDENGRLLPALATSWELSGDNLSYTFTLRPDVQFHDGTPFTAADVQATWQAGQEAANANFYLYRAASAVNVIDEQTVVLTTAEPNVLFLHDVARWGIISAAQYEAGGLAELEQNPNGTGPFRLVEWLTDGRIILEAHPAYWQTGLPHLARVIFLPLPEAAARAAAVQTGQIHLAQRLTATQAQQLLGVPNVRLVRYPTNQVHTIAFNQTAVPLPELEEAAEEPDAETSPETEEPLAELPVVSPPANPIESPLVRQAMNYAVNREAIGQRFFGGYIRLSTGFITPGQWGFDETIPPYPYDPDKARELLAEAGYPEGFTTSMACPVGLTASFEGVCRMVATDLAAVGITLTEGLVLLTTADTDALLAAQPNYALFGDSWASFESEGLARLHWVVGADSPFALWQDPELEAQLAEIGRTFDPAQRAQLYRTLTLAMLENPPFLYLYEPNAFEAVNGAVQNYTPRSNEEYDLTAVFLASER